MAKKNTLNYSRRFLTVRFKSKYIQQPQNNFRDIFPEGHWNSIKVNLELQGWSPAQIKMINNLLRYGWSLHNSLQQVSIRSSKCPVALKSFLITSLGHNEDI
tara:strand:- start:1063 stop:1368 length:306 start_codon:yes stop_codon:yes gene_type:complete